MSVKIGDFNEMILNAIGGIETGDPGIPEPSPHDPFSQTSAQEYEESVLVSGWKA